VRNGIREKQADMKISSKRTLQLNGTCAKHLVLFFVAGVSLAALRCDARADASGEPGNRWAIVRMQGILTLPLGSNHVEAWNDCGSGWLDYLSFNSTIDVNSSGGVLASFEYVVRRRYGLEIGLTYWRRIVNLRFEATGLTVEGSPNFIMPTIGVNYHFLTDKKKDFYGGALCALGVIATGFSTEIEVSKDVALGLGFGMDYYARESWSFGAAVKYIDFGELDFSVLPPGVQGIICNNGLFGLGHMSVVSLTCGIGYRF
jgi:opacity protein-like surface antigen